jgi:hypothetical protein
LGVDSDRPVGDDVGAFDQVVAREARLDLVVLGAPVEVPLIDPGSVEPYDPAGGEDQGELSRLRDGGTLRLEAPQR